MKPSKNPSQSPKMARRSRRGKSQKKKTIDWPFHLPWIIAVVVCAAICLIFGLAGVAHAPWHAGYLISLVVLATTCWMTRKIWTEFEVTAFYTAVLCGALVALLTGIYCLGLEMYAYNWDLKAKAGRPPAVAKGQITQPQPRPEPGAEEVTRRVAAELTLLIEFPAVDDRIAAGCQAAQLLGDLGAFGNRGGFQFAGEDV